MPSATAKNRKTKTKKLKLVAKNPRRIKAALKSWVAASETTNCDALNLDGAPAWAENALVEVTKIILPSKFLPTEGEWDLDLLGELVGRQRAFANLFTGEIPLSPEMQRDIEQIKEREAALPKTPELAARKKLLAKDFQNLLEANGQAIPELVAAVMASSHADTLKFQAGLARGLKLAAKDLNAGKIFQRYTRIFWVLGTQWRRFSQCRSVAEVHRILCAELGEDKVGSLKHFEARVAKKIGMKFGPAGRPAAKAI